MSGAAGSVASAELVVAMGKDGFIGSFGAGGLPRKVEDGIKYINLNSQRANLTLSTLSISL